MVGRWTTAWFRNMMLTRLDVIAKMPFPIHSDMLRHSFRRCPYTRTSMRKTLLSGLCLVGILVMMTKTENAEAQGPLSLFRNSAQAQRHCPNDTVVWLDLQRRIYYVQGQRQYGRGRTATFVCREEARRSGNRRSLLGIR